jgi:hypothetical protein
MFRKEYARELEDNQAALESQPLGPGGSITIPPITSGASGGEGSGAYLSIGAGSATGGSEGFLTGNSSVTDGQTTNPSPIQQAATPAGINTPTSTQVPPTAERMPPPEPASRGFWGTLFRRGKKPTE